MTDQKTWTTTTEERTAAAALAVMALGFVAWAWLHDPSNLLVGFAAALFLISPEKWRVR